MLRSFIYTQTRLQARHALRPDERSWQLAESQRDLGNFLQSARQGNLKHWVTGLQVTDQHHLLETALLKHYRDYIDDIASWVPTGWRKSVEWTKSLTYLPALQHLLGGNTPQAWMLQDPVLKQFTAIHQEQRSNAFLQSVYAPMVSAHMDGRPLLDVWLVRWQALWPDQRARQQANLQPLRSILQQHLLSFPLTAPGTGWRHRQELAHKLQMMFRRHSYQPVAIFVHLLLIALDVERLRGDIMQRQLFPKYREKSA
jgi:hypothetical protein